MYSVEQVKLFAQELFSNYFLHQPYASTAINPIPHVTTNQGTIRNHILKAEIENIVLAGLPKSLNMSIKDILYKLDNNEYLLALKALELKIDNIPDSLRESLEDE